MQLASARRRILTFWLIGAAVPFVIILVQTILGRYGTSAEEAWGWLLASTMPTVGLMLAVALTGEATKAHSSKLPARLCWAFSAVYLSLVNATLLVQPFTTWSAFELFKLSHLWLAPIQALVNATIAVLFLRPPTPRGVVNRRASRSKTDEP